MLTTCDFILILKIHSKLQTVYSFFFIFFSIDLNEWFKNFIGMFNWLLGLSQCHSKKWLKLQLGHVNSSEWSKYPEILCMYVHICIWYMYVCVYLYFFFNLCTANKIIKFARRGQQCSMRNKKEKNKKKLNNFQLRRVTRQTLWPEYCWEPPFAGSRCRLPLPGCRWNAAVHLSYSKMKWNDFAFLYSLKNN